MGLVIYLLPLVPRPGLDFNTFPHPAYKGEHIPLSASTLPQGLLSIENGGFLAKQRITPKVVPSTLAITIQLPGKARLLLSQSHWEKNSEAVSFITYTIFIAQSYYRC